MTREQFDKAVRFEKRNLGAHLGRVTATFGLQATMAFDASLDEASKHAEELLRERLWRELYGRRLSRYHELLDELEMCTPFGDWAKRHQLIAALHEVAPCEEKSREAITGCYYAPARQTC